MMCHNARVKGPLVHVVGARPNFIKLAPLYLQLRDEFEQQIIHTGQHYDRRMSGDFFDVLGLPEPDHNLAVGSGSHAEQTARIMMGLEKLFIEISPAAVIVYGDVNSTLAASLVASKLLIPCLHVEAGLRSNDRTMPEELNRLVTDQLSDVLLTPSRDANENLLREGISGDRIFFVGNIMIDTLNRMLPLTETIDLGDLPDSFALVTLHRPSNVDESGKLSRISEHLVQLSELLPMVFPVHPRTRACLDKLGFRPDSKRIKLIDPVDYLRFIAMQKKSRVVITDSGGIQEETTYLRKPCLTLRPNTERPVTTEIGTNTLIGDDPAAILPHLENILAGNYKLGQVPELWDGDTAARIKKILQDMSLCEPK
ncbi:non-hydrolyzing UDP-N-acetylglucosamine 2-epimerase [Desulfuromonas sp. TF]|uniref:non-hydrolyzing UDP-N-acetylglucosamine 2-epimerase n=1 Tax=Desulfuromonas sp. TF TaxID=1232410 RepID=UPI001D051749|nr:UDP-N-acetylglucosamine 2-epimerase (non-hydrolyzing) [Desulfuromonas sp. TF]